MSVSMMFSASMTESQLMQMPLMNIDEILQIESLSSQQQWNSLRIRSQKQRERVAFVTYVE